MSQTIAHLCQVCGQKTTYWCSRCHTSWYCSVEHMEYDWGTHRMYCRPFDEPGAPVGATESQSAQQIGSTSYYNNTYSSYQGGSVPNPQSPSSVPSGNGSNIVTHPNQPHASPTANFEALLFPFNEERPRIIRVQCLAQPQTSGPTIWTPLPQEWLGTEEISSHIITSGIGGAPLRFPLQVFYGAKSFDGNAPINRVIQRMTSGKSTYQWSGNIVALKFSGSRRQGYTDATYNDVAPLIASFLVPAESSNSS